jgi:uncharacterized protein YabN with tetrapyrrole methylase and pyrophosphatase domain
MKKRSSDCMMQKRVSAFSQLMKVIDILHGEKGCPWDKAQTRSDLMAKFREELKEYEAALIASDEKGMKEELGDLFLLVLFHAKIAEREETFTLSDVMDCLEKKLRRRHPHVFGDRKADSPEEVKEIWKEMKKKERNELE